MAEPKTAGPEWVEDYQKKKDRALKLLKSVKREGIDDLVDWLDKNEYFKSPASSKVDFHNAKYGGLLEHSLNVYDLFAKKNKDYSLGVPEESVAIATLLHDVCKAGLYKENYLKDGSISKPKPFVRDDATPLGHGEKSVYLVQKHIKLTDQEAMLIRWHMGPYDPTWAQYDYSKEIIEKAPEVVAMFTSDFEASTYLEKNSE